jgi:hypothetical protein
MSCQAQGAPKAMPRVVARACRVGCPVGAGVVVATTGDRVGCPVGAGVVVATIGDRAGWGDGPPVGEVEVVPAVRVGSVRSQSGAEPGPLKYSATPPTATSAAPPAHLAPDRRTVSRRCGWGDPEPDLGGSSTAFGGLG